VAGAWACVLSALQPSPSRSPSVRAAQENEPFKSTFNNTDAFHGAQLITGALGFERTYAPS